MYFTKEDYEKILSYILDHSKKDSEFEEVSNLIGTESVSIIQNNSNKKATINSILNPVILNLNNKADDTEVVHINNSETVSGDKTFSGEIIFNGNVIFPNGWEKIFGFGENLEEAIYNSSINNERLSNDIIYSISFDRLNKELTELEVASIGRTSIIKIKEGRGDLDYLTFTATSPSSKLLDYIVSSVSSDSTDIKKIFVAEETYDTQKELGTLESLVLTRDSSNKYKIRLVEL